MKYRARHGQISAWCRMGQLDIIVTDRESIESGIMVRTRYVVISIHDSGSRKPLVPRLGGMTAVLFVKFDDAEPSTNMECPATITFPPRIAASEL